MFNSNRCTTSHKIICWHLTNKCTRNCDFCLSKSGTNQKSSTTTNFRSIVDKIIELGFEKISYSGGEPFILPEFEDIVNYGNEKGLIQIVTTNGDLLKKYSQKDFIKKFQYIKFSFYGTSEYHDNLIENGHFQHLISLITELKQYDICIGINYMLTRQSYLVLEEFIEQIKGLNLYNLLIQSYIPTQNRNIDDKYVITDSNLSFLSHYTKFFEHGIKFFDYNINDGFQVILDESQNVYFPNTYNCTPFYYGNIFEEVKTFEPLGLIQLAELIDSTVNKRFVSNSIKTF